MVNLPRELPVGPASGPARDKPHGPAAKLLLLGGTGYIGSRLYQYLASRGVAVDTVDLEFRGNRINPDNIRMDYRDLTAQFLSAYDVVVLLAGHSTVAQSLRDPYGAFENNLVKFAHLLGKLAGQRFIYASSSSVYSGVGGQAVDESWNTFNFVNMYDFRNTPATPSLRCSTAIITPCASARSAAPPRIFGWVR